VTSRRRPARSEGIETRHQRNCASSSGARCDCTPSYRAAVYDQHTQRYLRRGFRSVAEARSWRAEALVALRQGGLTAAPTPTLAQAAEAWIAGARAGAVRNRSGDTYKPSVVRGYEQSLRLRILPVLGGVRLADLRRSQLQAFVDRMLLDGTGASTIRNTLMPVRVICRRAVARGEIAVNPTVGLELPAVRGRRDRIASPEEAAALLAALPVDRPLWATAMYAGLRLGELLALDWSAVDLDAGLIQVRRAWDQEEGFIEPKSRAGVRAVPLADVLRRHLVEQRLACPWSDGLVFGRAPDRPFLPNTPNNRAQRAWRDAGLRPIGLHECRHTFASFMIAAGVNAKALSTHMGHSSVTITFDRYGHLMPGNEAEAAALLDRYLSSRAAAGGV
jgi:integrase